MNKLVLFVGNGQGFTFPCDANLCPHKEGKTKSGLACHLVRIKTEGTARFVCIEPVGGAFGEGKNASIRPLVCGKRWFASAPTRAVPVFSAMTSPVVSSSATTGCLDSFCAKPVNSANSGGTVVRFASARHRPPDRGGQQSRSLGPPFSVWLCTPSWPRSLATRGLNRPVARGLGPTGSLVPPHRSLGALEPIAQTRHAGHLRTKVHRPKRTSVKQSRWDRSSALEASESVARASGYGTCLCKRQSSRCRHALPLTPEGAQLLKVLEPRLRGLEWGRRVQT
ncbi:unnamed protein product, partial [Protopolystoma xenopodis]